MTEQKNIANPGFEGLGISESILEVLKKMELAIPTPIQKKAIPVAIDGKDLIGVAQTGTGKTFAFGIPMLQRLALYKGRGLVLLPTRELALQVEESLQKLGMSLGLRTAALIGGEPIGKQMQVLRRNPHIIVATPGRLNDHIKRKSISLKEVKVLVLDEADMMLDMGFLPQVKEILSHVTHVHQTMLFSATMPVAIVRLASDHMALPVSIEVAPAGTTAEHIRQEMFIMKKEDKLTHLEKLLKQYTGSVLVFARTRHSAKSLTRSIHLMAHTVAEIHSDRSLDQRKKALAGFKAGKFRVLVATDIAARGIDVKDIELVLNYDLPDNSEDYVHRIGRTARAGKKGIAISFAMPSQSKEIRSIERLINKNLPLTKFAELDKAPAFTSGRRKKGGFSRPKSAAFAGSKFSSSSQQRPGGQNRSPWQRTEAPARSGFKPGGERPAARAKQDFGSRTNRSR